MQVHESSRGRDGIVSTIDKGDSPMKRLLGCVLPVLLTTLALAGCGSGGKTKGGGGGEANLKLPSLNEQVGNVSGTTLLWIGLVICLFGLGFGLVTYSKLQKLPVHKAMHEVSELIYETCKTYLRQQAKFLMLLWAFIAAVIVVYFLFLEHMGAKVLIILLFSLVGWQDLSESPGMAFASTLSRTPVPPMRHCAVPHGRPSTFPCVLA